MATTTTRWVRKGGMFFSFFAFRPSRMVRGMCRFFFLSSDLFIFFYALNEPFISCYAEK